MNAVDSVLVELIKSFPTLRQTRNDALYDLCSKSPEYCDEIRWNDEGNIELVVHYPEHDCVYSDDNENIARAMAKIESSEEGTSGHRAAVQSYASRKLFQNRENAKAAFTRDNAELIVQSHDHEFGTTCPNYNAFKFLETIPENANPEWIDAFVGLANDIIYFSYNPGRFSRYIPSYGERYEAELVKAKEAAQAFLIRIKGSDTEKHDLAKAQIEKEIAALVAKAAKVGVSVEATVE